MKQPFNPGVGAKPRAWALKPALTTWKSSRTSAAPRALSVSVHAALGLTPVDDFEDVW